MTKKIIRVGVIACGTRSQCVVGNLLRDSGGAVQVTRVYDPDEAVCRQAIQDWQIHDCRIAATADEVIHDPAIDWIMIFSPNSSHRGYIEAAFAAGKHIFTEKPLATGIADCQAIYRAHRAHPEQFFATGFVLRYAPIYREAKRLLDSGELGRLLAIQANENITPQHGGYIMCNWRRLTRDAGPHILEKCCHDLDLINWFCQSHVKRVASFGARRFFTPENATLERKYGLETFKAWRDPHAVASPFTSDKDLMDVQVAVAEYRNGILVNFMATMSNPLPERRMYFSCTEGTMILELYSGTLRYRRMGETYEHVQNFGGDGHGGGDDVIMKELYATMSENVPPVCSGNEGLESAVFAMALNDAAESGVVIDLEPVWQSLGRNDSDPAT